MHQWNGAADRLQAPETCHTADKHAGSVWLASNVWPAPSQARACKVTQLKGSLLLPVHSSSPVRNVKGNVKVVRTAAACA